MSHQTNRRRFLKTTAAAGVGFWVAGGVSARESISPNERIQFACVGVEGKGKSDSDHAKWHGDVVAICDIDDHRLGEASKRLGGARRFVDYREMFDVMGDRIDAVTVSTPDHHHAPAAARALRRNIHCYCQKPLTHSIHEARKLTELAAESGAATQMGNQGSDGSNLRKAAAIVQSGALGPVREVHVWTDRPGDYWKQGLPRPAEAAIPKHVHWDLFLGPAPARPYGPGYHPFAWRGWWDFGTGALGDMACHVVNMAFHALDLRDPIAVQATTSGHNRDSYPKWSIIDFEFGALGKRGPLKMRWYDGGKLPDKELFGGETPSAAGGSAIIGESGTLLALDTHVGSYKLLGGVEEPKVEFVRSPGHFEEWIRAIRGGAPGISNFVDAGGPMTETVLLGNLAVWSAVEAETPGKRIEWDAKQLKPTNAPELAAIVRREYREGYEL